MLRPDGAAGVLRRVAGAVLLCALPQSQAAPASALAPAVAAAASAASSARFPMDAAAVRAATTALRAETGTGETHKEHTWRFKRTNDPKPASPDPWLLGLGRWLAEGGRVLIWLLGAAALALVVVMAGRWMQVRADLPGAGTRLPSHVRELDIRPESLPADIGAAVRALWLAGEHRAALSLLYRGALSRLVHAHGVAIGDSSTEGDCVSLARSALPAEPAGYFQALVQAWLLATYGARPLESTRVLQLCDDFERMLPAAQPRRASAPAA